MTVSATAPRSHYLHKIAVSDRGMTGIIVCGHVALCCFLSYALSVGVDETYTLASTAAGPVRAFYQALSFELQPPVYFVVAALWRTLDDSLFFLRLLSTLCTAGALILMPAIARCYLPQANQRTLMLLVAINPLAVYAGTEARCYGLVLLISAVLVLSFHLAFTADEPDKKKRFRLLLIHLTAGLAGLLTFYPLGFLLAAQGVCLIVLWRWRDALRYLASMAVITLLALPLLLAVPDQVGSHSAQTTVATPPFSEVARLVAWIARDLVLPVRWSIGDQLSPVLWLSFVVAVLVAAVRKRTLFLSAHVLSSATQMTVCTVLLMALATLTGTETFGPRYTVPLLLPLLVFCLAVSAAAFGRKGLIFVTCVILPFSGVSLFARHSTLAKGGDWRHAAGFVMSQEAAGQDVLVFRPPAALGFGYYYRGVNSLVPLPCEERCEQYDVSKYILHDESEVATHFSRFAADDVFWLVTEHQSLARRERFGFDHLDDWLAANCTLDREAQFQGSTVRQFRVRKPIHAAESVERANDATSETQTHTRHIAAD